MPAPLTILSTLAVKGALDEILPSYTATHVNAEYGPTLKLLDLIGSGVHADIAILTDTAIDSLIASGTMAAGSRVDIARSFIGAAVCAGAKQPDITTPDAFRKTLLEVRSIAFSAVGASGVFFADLIEKLGISVEIREKATIVPAGIAGTLAAEGKVELAIQQVSALMAVPGVDVVGRLPTELHDGALFCGAVFSGTDPEAAALLQFLADPAFAPVYARHGVEPMGS